MMRPEHRAYITLLADTLKKKEQLLRLIDEQTKEQGRILRSESMDALAFEKILEEKEKEIQQLQELDEGFDAIFRRIEKHLEEYKDECKSEIQAMQKLIRDITGLSVSIQAQEKQNTTAFQLYLTSEKNSIREKTISSRTASSYYKQMTNQHTGMQSVFIDKSN